MLRDYQQDMYDKAKEALRTHKGVCCVLPCRSGKSYVMKAMVDSACSKGNSVLIIAHRKLLLSQHRKLIGNCRIESVFTEANHLGEHGKPDLIIIDEAHLSGAESYHKVCDYYGCKRILFTATAKRLDGKPLDLADMVINGISADELIRRGDVSPYDLYAPKIGIDLSKASMSGYDFNNDDITDIMMDHKIYGDIIHYYEKLAGGKQAIAYCASVKHSQSVCELLNSNGISAVHMDGSMPEKERETVMSDYKNGKYRVLTCCNVISEGITLPECDCCLLLRPTQSESLYIQQACRCLTPRQGKRAVIIDYVGNCYAHGMPTEKREYALEQQNKVMCPKRTPETIVRECSHCFKVYRGNDRICPYCGADNGKTRKQIEQEQAELEKIEEIDRKKRERMEVGMCKDFGALVKLGIKRNYPHPQAWAYRIINARKNKKGITFGK